MAENESLDIRNIHSTRWRVLRGRILAGTTDEAVAKILLENLYQTFKKVVRQIPLGALLNAMQTEGDVRAVLRECRNHEYAQLISRQFEPGLGAVGILEHALWATVDRFLDQIQHDAVPSRNWPDMVTYDLAQDAWRAAIFDDLRHLAQVLADDPAHPPRMPSRSSEERAQDMTILNSMSLLRDFGGQDDRH
jgi:hypothetical protein